MPTESLGKVLPQIVLPYVQQWADRSGLTLLSRLLADDKFRELIEKYSDGLAIPLSPTGAAPGNGKGQTNGHRPTSHAEPHVRNVRTEATAGDLTSMHARLLAMEAQHESDLNLFATLRLQIRPLALALGCCPKCLVGVEGCPKCLGRSKVAHYQPDYTLLKMQIVNPLAARGVPLTLSETTPSVSGDESRESSTKTRSSKPWPKK
jgi:hypothetical protein